MNQPPPSRFRWRQYRLLLRYAYRRRRGWAAIGVVTIVSTGLGLLVPLTMKVIVDNVIGHHALGPILTLLPGAHDKQVLLAWAASGEFVFFALATTLEIVSTMLWIRVAQRMVYELSRDLFARVQRQSLIEHSHHPVGDTIARVANDCWCVHTVVDELLFTPIQAVATSAGILFIMVELNLSLTLVAVAVTPLMVVASLASGRPVRGAAERKRKIQGELQSHVQQTLSGISVVKAFGQEARQQRRFEELAVAAIRSQLRAVFAGGFSGLVSGLVAALGAGAVLAVGAHDVVAGSLSVGSLLVFIAYARTLQVQLRGCANIYTALQGARASVDRVGELLDAPDGVRESAHAHRLTTVHGHVQIDHVTFAYQGGRPVLQNVSLEARPGQRIAIVGRSGAGKSTLVSLLPRLFDPDQGRVLLDGHDLRDLKLSTVREAISIVLQEPFLFPVSVAANIAFGAPDASRQEIVAAAKAANAHGFIARLPDGYDSQLGERGATLSGGERQRIAIARALLKDAPVLILDEPTAQLDAVTESSLLEVLERLMAHRTTLVIAHRLSTVREADEILVLDDGRVVERGTHEALLHHGGTYVQLYAQQATPPSTWAAGAA